MFNWLKNLFAVPARSSEYSFSVPDRERAKVLNDEGIRDAWGNPELGKQKLMAAIRADPTWGIPWNNLGVIYRDQGNGDEALRCLRRAIELGALR